MKKISSLISLYILAYTPLEAAAGAYWLEDSHGFLIAVYGYTIYSQYTPANITNPSIDGFVEEQGALDTWLNQHHLSTMITIHKTPIYNANKGAWAIIAQLFNNRCISFFAFNTNIQKAVKTAQKKLKSTHLSDMPYSIVATGYFDVSKIGAKNIDRHQWLITKTL